MYFDTHMHFFPDFLAPKAIDRIVGVCRLPNYTDGTLSDTQAKMKEWGYAGGVILHIATNARQQKSVNDFAAESQGGNIMCFGSVHPLDEDAVAELNRLYSLGLRGIKLHPDYQEFFVDDKAVFPVYAEAERLGLTITFHTGRDPYSPSLIHCTPKGLSTVADTFPNLKIISAHMGGSYMPKDSAKYLSGKKNVWFDTAFIHNFLNASQFEELSQILGIDRIFYATDTPWSTMPKITGIIESTTLSVEEKELIYYKNAFEFFGLNMEKAKTGLPFI